MIAGKHTLFIKTMTALVGGLVPSQWRRSLTLYGVIIEANAYKNMKYAHDLCSFALLYTVSKVLIYVLS